MDTQTAQVRDELLANLHPHRYHSPPILTRRRRHPPRECQP